MTPQGTAAYELGRRAAAYGYERRSPYKNCAAEKCWYDGFDSVVSTSRVSQTAIDTINKFYYCKITK